QSQNTFVDPKSNGTDDEGGGKDDGGHPPLAAAQGASADGGGDDGGQTANTGDQDERSELEGSEASHVAQHVLGRAGQQEGHQQKEVDAARVLEKPQGLDFLPGDEDLHGPDAETPDEEKDKRTADGRAEDAEDGSLHSAEGVARADLQGLPG